MKVKMQCVDFSYTTSISHGPRWAFAIVQSSVSSVLMILVFSKSQIRDGTLFFVWRSCWRISARISSPTASSMHRTILAINAGERKILAVCMWHPLNLLWRYYRRFTKKCQDAFINSCSCCSAILVGRRHRDLREGILSASWHLNWRSLKEFESKNK